MIPLAIGLGILGVCAMRRAHRGCGYYGHGCGGHHYDGSDWRDGGGGWAGPPWMWRHQMRRHGRRRWMLNAALARIDATPAQERAIVAEINKLEERMHGAKASLRDVRGDLANALRGPSLDDAALGAVLDALRAIHGILDDGQRAQLADLLEGGLGRGWRGHGGHGGPGGGPYRV